MVNIIVSIIYTKNANCNPLRRRRLVPARRPGALASEARAHLLRVTPTGSASTACIC